MIELRMFSQRSFRLAIGAMMLVYVAHYGRLVFIPLQLEGLRGESALRVGLLFLPPALATAVGMSLGGRLVDRLGPRLPIQIGCTCVFVGMVGFARLTLTTPLAVIGVLLSIHGFGVGITSAPALVAGLSELPSRLMARGTAVRALAAQVSGAIAVAVLGAVYAARAGAHPSLARAQAAYDTAFAVTGVGVLFALFLASRLPRGTASRARDRDEAVAVE
jgi:MFS family permease